MGVRSRFSTEIAVPVFLLIALGTVIWVSVFANGLDEVQPNLQARGENELPGLHAAHFAFDEIRAAVPNRTAEHTGLLAGPPTSVSIFYRELGSSSNWIVHIRGPLRVRPNTPEEFVSRDGEILIELTAINGDVMRFSAGRGVLREIDVPLEDFIEIPVHMVWPPRDVWIRL